MIKVRFNLRKVATIVACLAVTTMFAACDKTNDDNGANSAGKLVDHWTRTIGSNFYHWFINKDGTFHYFKVSAAEYSYKGNYTASDGKIYFTKVVFTSGSIDGGDDYVNNEPDSWVEYEFALDSDGKEQLRITNSGGSFTGSTWWYRAK